MSEQKEYVKVAVCQKCGAKGYFAGIAWFHDTPVRHQFVPVEVTAPKPVEAAQPTKWMCWHNCPHCSADLNTEGWENGETRHCDYCHKAFNADGPVAPTPTKPLEPEQEMLCPVCHKPMHLEYGDNGQDVWCHEDSEAHYACEKLREPKPALQTCEHGVLTADHCKTCDPAPRVEGFEEWWLPFLIDKDPGPEAIAAKFIAKSAWSAAQAPLLQKIGELEAIIEIQKCECDPSEACELFQRARKAKARIAELEAQILESKAEHGNTLLSLHKAAFETIPALESRISELESALAQKKWIDANQEKPRTGRLCLVVWRGVVQHTPYSRQGIGFACEEGYEWRAPEELEVDAMPDEEVELWMYLPEVSQPNADDEEKDK